MKKHWPKGKWRIQAYIQAIYTCIYLWVDFSFAFNFLAVNVLPFFILFAHFFCLSIVSFSLPFRFLFRPKLSSMMSYKQPTGLPIRENDVLSQKIFVGELEFGKCSCAVPKVFRTHDIYIQLENIVDR